MECETTPALYNECQMDFWDFLEEQDISHEIAISILSYLQDNRCLLDNEKRELIDTEFSSHSVETQTVTDVIKLLNSLDYVARLDALYALAKIGKVNPAESFREIDDMQCELGQDADVFIEVTARDAFDNKISTVTY